MKANIKKDITIQPDIKNYDKALTVGMIVKNEAKVLERCLESLTKLRNKINMEIIVTDTGSTDKTVSIAEKYADIVNHFEWCNDFAKARNVAMDIARGEWFIYIDADEWLSDELIESIVFFLQNPDQKFYNSLTFFLRNFNNIQQTSYNDIYCVRGIRMSIGERFVNPIHEILKCTDPTKVLTGAFNHTGYVYTSKKEQLTKAQRNNTLIEEFLKENPNDIGMLVSYFQTATKEKREEISLKLKSLITPELSLDAYIKATIPRLEHLVATDKANEAALEAEEYLSCRQSAHYVDAYYWACKAFLATGQHQRCIDVAKKYFDDVSEYRENPVQERYGYVAKANIICQTEIVVCALKASIELNNGALAIDFFKKLELCEDNCIEMTLQMLVLHENHITDDALSELNNALYALKKSEQRNNAFNTLCANLLSDPANPDTLRSLKKLQQDTPIVSLYCGISAMDFSACKTITFETAEEHGVLPMYLLSLIFCKSNIAPALDKISVDNLNKYCADISVYSKLPDIFDILELNDSNNLKLLILRTCLNLKILSFTTDLDKKFVVASAVIRDWTLYVHKVYNAKLINECADLLPENYRFAIKLEDAKNDINEYLLVLREAAKSRSVVSDLAKAILKGDY